MSKVLVSTIVRNRGDFVYQWYDQVRELNLLLKEDGYDLFVSIYENDSEDDTVEKLNKLDLTIFWGSHLTCAKTGASIPRDLERQGRLDLRVAALAEARNKTIKAAGDLSKFKYFLIIESDITYNPLDLLSIIKDKEDLDIYSAKSVALWGFNDQLYDSWATRLNNQCNNTSYWPLGHEYSMVNPVPVWSTFNCFCRYKMQPIIDGIRFSGINPRLKTYDCDTVNICESFRLAGYGKIFFNRDIKVIQHNQT